MNVLGICAGVGGLELGIRIAEPGARGVLYLEREAYAAANLVARMEDGWLHPAPVWSDLGTFDPEPWRGVVHCVASGDPCQPNSVAGQRKGADDDRWLIDHVLRVVDCLRPARFFRENVPGNSEGQLAALVPALEGMGYRVAAGIFSAAEAGASHRRERLFIMADRDEHRQRAWGGDERSPDCPGSQHGHDPERCGGELGYSEGDGWRKGRPKHEFRGGRNSASEHGRELGNAHDTGLGAGGRSRLHCQGQQGTFAEQPGPGGMADAGEQGLPITEQPGQPGQPGQAERGLEAGPTATEFRGRPLPLFAPGPSDPRWVQILGDAPHLEPAVRRVADGLANRVDRLRATGNGVFPLAAAYAWRALDAALRIERGAGAGIAAVTEGAA